MNPPQWLNFAIVTSTAGSVMDDVLRDPFLRERVRVVVADRPCEGLAKAEAHGLATTLIDADSVEAFGEGLLERLAGEEIDYILSYYTEFYAQAVRDEYEDRIVNFHPSLLPAFKGMDGFGDAVAYPARFTGNTVEFIADVMDEGKIIMQTVCPIDVGRPIAVTRHRLFEQQCKALLQLVRWLEAGRVTVDGGTVTVADAVFDDIEFSPSIDSPEVAAWTVRDHEPLERVTS